MHKIIYGPLLLFAYKALEGNSGLRLSDVFTLYYKGEAHLRAGLTRDTVNWPYHKVENRWFIFSKYMKLLKQTGSTYQWLPVASTATPSPDWKVVRDTWRLRMAFVAQMWMAKMDHSIRFGLSNYFAPAVPMNTIWVDWSLEDASHSYTQMTYPNPVDDTITAPCRVKMRETMGLFFEDKFLQDFVKPRLQNEALHTGISITF